MRATGTHIYIRLLSTEDVNSEYVNWMNDPEVTQYLESRWDAHSLKSTLEYVDAINHDQNNFLFGIFLVTENTHIGNVKIGNINHIHRYADIGIAIGNKSTWMKGIGSEVMDLVERIVFEELNLNKICAGIYSNNVRSLKMFEKCGWRKVGVQEKHVYYKGKYIDTVLVEKLMGNSEN